MNPPPNTRPARAADRQPVNAQTALEAKMAGGMKPARQEAILCEQGQVV